ncbi:helix-turn-helix domain-containing protein [Actinoplanes sp. N902-109]|uniref:winged helix-turn-helix transcriptional regulator n=1 Tax=Actinoplanes sp. (strain N902-109) TaxID=649831 RepID=UPI00032945F9|nr:helix-turn-helix domain-containing protein [Actinoplanes sp. N902-109]AGL13825.1 transcriptional regulator [Actinoplanes sp. N902-109]
MSDSSAVQAGCKAIVAEKWALMVINELGPGPRRFTELKRAIDGVSQRMLTVTLRSLERDGLLTREVVEVMPPNVTYQLTAMGRALLAAVEPMLQWSVDNLPRIEAARAEYDAR